MRGVATRDAGIGKDGVPKSTFERGYELHGRVTLFAEGARGSCSEEVSGSVRKTLTKIFLLVKRVCQS